MSDDITELRAAMRSLTYPPYQEYDPADLSPLGATKARAALMERNLPELMEGGNSLLDVGSSKGFVSLFLRDRFKLVHGYEMSSEACALADATRQHLGAEHVQFFNKTFRQIPIGKQKPPAMSYDVVYVGSAHHHFIKDAILHGAPMFLPLKKLAALADRYLILDGRLEIAEWSDDASLSAWSREYGWSDAIRHQYTLHNHVAALEPQFQLVRGPVPNDRGTVAAVFKRVLPNMPIRETSEEEVAAVRSEGETVTSNRNRESASVVRVGPLRYKFDRGLQTDAVFMVLNALPEWFPRTHAILTQNGERIGDVAEWIDGRPVENPTDLWRHWLRLNNVLASVGLVEPQFKIGDLVSRGYRMLDVDIDMIQDINGLRENEEYHERLSTSITNLFADHWNEQSRMLLGDLANEWAFLEAENR